MANPIVDSVLHGELTSYFSRHLDQYDELRQIINAKSRPRKAKSKRKHGLPSLRTLEYVVTHLSRYKNTGQGFYSDKKGERFYVDIHNMYKTMLGTHSKKKFDSFRRTKNIAFSVPDRKDAPIQTTIAQLWWCKWIYERQIMLHVKKNWPAVRKEMAQALKKQRQYKKRGIDRQKSKRRAFYQQVHTNDIVLKWN